MISIDAMRDEDWRAVRAIYLEGIATGLATFETAAPEWHQWDNEHLPHGRLVARDDGAVVGWAALSAVSGRCVYAGVAEVSVYVSPARAGRGIGKALLGELITASERAGLWTLEAGVFVENEASLALHRGCGFREVGRRERLGQLRGVWRDVVLLERRSDKDFGDRQPTAVAPDHGTDVSGGAGANERGAAEDRHSSSDEFRAAGIDHVELFVPHRREAAEWYRRTLGLRTLPEAEAWAADRRGPLMISSDGGVTKLALFRGAPQGPKTTAGFHRVAFKAGARAFVDFLECLDGLRLTDHRGRRVTAKMVVDHQTAYSVYFCDPFGHRLELTTYDHEDVGRRLKRLQEDG